MRGVPRPSSAAFRTGTAGAGGTPNRSHLSVLTLVPQLTQSPITAQILTLGLNTGSEGILLGLPDTVS